jgi:High-affinity nickel-transport protein
MNLTLILLAGFLLGVKHATEPDHLAAVATLSAGRQTVAQTVRQGVAWGIGHAATLMLFGGLVLALGKAVPPWMAQALEFAVALMLMGLGAEVLVRLKRQKVHFHAHHHAASVLHLHAHSHLDDASTKSANHSFQAHGHPHGLPMRALSVGMMHGMAGSAALILLSLEAVESLGLGLVYIALFGLGSVAGMALLSVAIAVPMRLSASGRLTWLHKGITAAVGIASCLLGAAMVVHIGASGILSV